MVPRILHLSVKDFHKGFARSLSLLCWSGTNYPIRDLVVGGWSIGAASASGAKALGPSATVPSFAPIDVTELLPLTFSLLARPLPLPLPIGAIDALGRLANRSCSYWWCQICKSWCYWTFSCTSCCTLPSFFSTLASISCSLRLSCSIFFLTCPAIVAIWVTFSTS